MPAAATADVVEADVVDQADVVDEADVVVVGYGAAGAAGTPDPQAAAATVAAYNEACAAGSDPLGRPANTLVPLDQPPYYCVPLYPGGSNTTRGPRRNADTIPSAVAAESSADAEVLDVFGAVIPGLYAAGELGQASGLLYPADGSNLSEAFCFAPIAAESALGRPRGATE